ncbi:hypothetical protein RCO48_16160 [Peribacillus frigoritolerans]|nr:hypothetical protein [Peribacillus frigoritolerans]
MKDRFPEFLVKELDIDNDGSYTAILSEQEKKGIEVFEIVSRVHLPSI